MVSRLSSSLILERNILIAAVSEERVSALMRIYGAELDSY